jgi:hypothetical protein
MSFYQSSNPKQWKWKPGIYFKQAGQVYRLASWLNEKEGLALVSPLHTNYTVYISLYVSHAAWRVRKDGREYKRTSRLSALARRRNADLGRLEGIYKNLENLIQQLPSSDKARAWLLSNFRYPMQAVRAQIDYEWRLNSKREKDKQASKGMNSGA